MAEGKIIFNDLFDANLLKQIADLRGEIDATLKSLQAMKTTLPKSGNKPGDTEKLNAAQKERIRLQEKLDSLEKDEFKTNEKLKQQIAERLAQTKAEIKEQSAKEGSMKQLAARLQQLKDQYRSMSKEEREGTAQGRELLKNIQSQDKEIKKLDSTLGDHQRNVGNYTGSILDAAKNSKFFGGTVNAVTGAMSATKKGFTVVKAGFVSMKTALMSTGIGALIVLLGSLITYFTKTSEGVRTINRYMAGLGGAIDIVVDALATFGRKMIDAISQPKKIWDSFKSYIEQKIVPMFAGLGDIIAGIFTFDWGQVADGAKKVSDSASAIGEDWKEMGKNIGQYWDDMGTAMADAAKRSFELERRRQALEDAERSFGVEMAKNKKTISELRLMANDQTKSYEERLAAITKADQMEQNQLNTSIKLSNERLNIAKEQGELNRKDGKLQIEDLDSIAEAEKEVYHVQEESFNKRRELMEKMSTFRKGIEAEEQKEIIAKLALEQAEIDIRNKIAEIDQKALEGFTDFLDKELEAIDNYLAEFDEKYIESVNKRQEADKEARDFTTEILDRGKDQDLLRMNDELAILEQNLQEKIGDTKQTEEAILQIKEEIEAKKLAVTADTLGAAASLFEENTAAYKALASAQAIINTLLTVTEIIKAWSGTGPWGYAIGAAQAAIALASGMATVAKINGVKFEDGEVDIKGRRHSQGGIVAEIEGGESVINRTGTRNAKDTLELINSGRLTDNMIIPMLAMKAGAQHGGVSVNNSDVVNEIKQTNQLLSKFKFYSQDGKKVLDIHGNLVRYV